MEGTTLHRYLANNRVGFFQSDEALSSSKFCTVFSGDLSRTSYSLPPPPPPPPHPLRSALSNTHCRLVVTQSACQATWHVVCLTEAEVEMVLWSSSKTCIPRVCFYNFTQGKWEGCLLLLLLLLLSTALLTTLVPQQFLAHRESH